MTYVIRLRSIAIFTLWSIFLLAFVTVGQTLPGRENGKIAFTSEKDGNFEIYSINPNGTELRRLTFNPGEDNYPAWSPDGRKIAFLSEIPPSGGGQALLKIMLADGSGQRVVTPIDISLNTTNFCGERLSLDWSPDGSKIVFQEFGNIVTVNIDGTNRQNVTNTSVRESEPSWGSMNQIAYASSDTKQSQPNSGLWIYLTTFPGINFGHYGYYTCAVSPDFSADGAKLAYVDGNDLIPPGKISIVDPNPPFNGRDLGFYGVMTVRWSPDGNFLVFGSLTYPNYRIEVIDQFGQGRRVLTEGMGINPSWQNLADEVSISGRVLTPGGQGLRNTVVTLTDPQGVRRTAVTSSLGYFQFDNVATGHKYILGAASRRYRFDPRELEVNGSLTNLEIVGQE